jgi:hypothetical protein
MAYRERTKELVKATPLTLGSRLGRRAVYLGVPVIDLARLTGATRKTCYNWMFGGFVIPAYKARVEALYEILKDSKSAEEALKRANKKFGASN